MKKNKLKNNHYSKSNDHGYVTLITILVIGAVGLSVATSLVTLGLGSSRNSFALEQSSKAKALADTCAEEALQRIWDADTFVGTGNITLGQGSCSFAVTNATAPKLITVSGNVGNIIRKVSITLDSVNPYLNSSPWQEVAD